MISGAKDSWRRDDESDEKLHTYGITTDSQIKAAPHSNSIAVSSSYSLGNNKVRFTGSQLHPAIHEFRDMPTLAPVLLVALGESDSVAAVLKEDCSTYIAPSNQPDLSDDGAFLFSTSR